MKTYVLTLAKQFPAQHINAGKPTFFKAHIELGNKLHTIRQNYELWNKRFEQIKAGKACLSVREWSDKPYKSMQIELFNFTNIDNIALQKLEITYFGYKIDNFLKSDLTIEQICLNDGLSKEHFLSWFKDWYLIKTPLAIIHLTKFRY